MSKDNKTLVTFVLIAVLAIFRGYLFSRGVKGKDKDNSAKKAITAIVKHEEETLGRVVYIREKVKDEFKDVRGDKLITAFGDELSAFESRSADNK